MSVAERNLAFLEEQSIPYTLARHAPVFTLEAMVEALVDIAAEHDAIVKNLFLKSVILIEKHRHFGKTEGITRAPSYGTIFP